MTAPRPSTAALPWAAVAAALLALAAGAVSVQHPKVALVLALAVCTISVGGAFAARLPSWFLTTLWALLVVYAVFGKGGAYLNVGGIFVGELVLALGVAALVIGGAARALAVRSLLVWGIVAFGAWGALQTVPYLGAYGMDALRDAVTWAYAAYALLVASMLTQTGSTHKVVERYGKWLLWFPVWVPIAWALSRFAWDWLPAAPGSDIPLVYFKAGDATMHLMGVAAFVLLGLHRRTERRTWWVPGGWVWWCAWLGATGIVSGVARGCMLAILVGGAIVLVLRPATRLWRPVTATLVLALVFWTSGIRIQVRDGRFLSAPDIAANVLSIGGASVEGDRNATRNWRLEWWKTIIDYTVRGPYFWTGKGFGVNLAQADGFVVGDTENRPLRSPHSGHMTILARSGVPGAVLWAALQVGFAIALLRAYRRAAHTSADWWARVDLWILACWATFIVNAAFEVSLESPQGGIWFWSLFGFGIAVLRQQRRVSMRVGTADEPVIAGPWQTRVGYGRAGV